MIPQEINLSQGIDRDVIGGGRSDRCVTLDSPARAQVIEIGKQGKSDSVPPPRVMRITAMTRRERSVMNSVMRYQPITSES